MQKQTPRKTYAFVGDGETEQWYLQMLKKNEANLTVTIKPELPQDKSIEDQFAYVQELSAVHDIHPRDFFLAILTVRSYITTAPHCIQNGSGLYVHPEALTLQNTVSYGLCQKSAFGSSR